MQQFDLFVLGTGPAGQRAAVQAAKLGKKVGICERREMVGGVCVNTGTIPSKTFREAVLYLSGIAQRANYGASYSVKDDITIEDLLFRCHQVIAREIDVLVDTVFNYPTFAECYKVAPLDAYNKLRADADS